MRETKEYDLWEAVIVRAILDLQSSNKEVKEEAEEWLYWENADFQTVCEMLEINPERLRKKVKSGEVNICRIKS